MADVYAAIQRNTNLSYLRSEVSIKLPERIVSVTKLVCGIQEPFMILFGLVSA